MLRQHAQLLFTALGAALLVSCEGGSAAEGPRTVALLSLDTVRYDFADYADPELTPNLARLADRGTAFDRAYSGSSWTLPAHAQMFSGQPPALHGVQDDNVRIDPLTPTLPELFSAAGWATFGAFSGWYLVKDYGFGRGFDAYVNAMPGGAEFERQFQRALREGGNSGGTWAAADLQSHRAVTSPDVVARLIDGIQLANDRDLFLFGHFFDPHYDYVPPVEFVERFDPGYTGSMTGVDFYSNKAIWDESRGGRQISDRDLQHILALYRAEIAWTDRNLGEFFDALKAEARLENAWIAVTADHGEEFFDHGRRGHRQTLFEEQVHVPLLIVPPVGSGGPRRSEVRTSLTDLAPTLCDAVGLAPVASHAGRSLAGLWRGQELVDRPAVHSLMRTVVSTQGIKHRVLDGVTVDGLKLVRELIAKGGELQLRSAVAYDLERDPDELAPTNDLSDERLARAWSALEAEHARLRSLAGQLPQSDAAERSSAAKEMFLSQLAALGYMDEGEAAGRVEPPWGFQPPPAVSLDAAKGE